LLVTICMKCCWDLGVTVWHWDWCRGCGWVPERPSIEWDCRLK
jgi:hypothetical protein